MEEEILKINLRNIDSHKQSELEMEMKINKTKDQSKNVFALV
ncbi:hypothetical protein P2W68_16805 [Chryseobacterium arthrosphaerae]|nr:hypothetical protein [Chryseobacterium arthrosphaerae]WES96495.1 hypothetical protein P2W68_16805 [Chryseobacterium arthrosphaerae]